MLNWDTLDTVNILQYISAFVERCNLQQILLLYQMVYTVKALGPFTSTTWDALVQRQTFFSALMIVIHLTVLIWMMLVFSAKNKVRLYLKP